MRRFPFFAVLILVVLLPACKAKDNREVVEILTVDQVPKPALDAAKKKLPGYVFKSFYSKMLDNQKIFEIRGTNSKGEIHEVEVNAEGNIVGVE